MGRSHRSQLPLNVRKVIIGYEATARVRTLGGWRTMIAWSWTAKGARRRLDRMISEVLWGDLRE